MEKESHPLLARKKKETRHETNIQPLFFKMLRPKMIMWETRFLYMALELERNLTCTGSAQTAAPIQGLTQLEVLQSQKDPLGNENPWKSNGQPIPSDGGVHPSPGLSWVLQI